MEQAKTYGHKHHFAAIKFAVVTAVCFCFSVSAYAQNDTVKNLKGGIIGYVPGGFFKNGYPTIDGQRVKFSYVSNLLNNYEPSKADYLRYKTDRTWTYIMAGAAAAFAIASYPTNGGANTYQKPLAKVFICTGFGFIIPEYIFASKARKHYRKSEKIYNEQFK